MHILEFHVAEKIDFSILILENRFLKYKQLSNFNSNIYFEEHSLTQQIYANPILASITEMSV